MQTSPPAKPRQLYLDAARVFAVISITVNHAVNRSYDNYYNQQWEFQNLGLGDSVIKAVVTVFSHLGVQLFLMISGALLLQKRMEDSHDLKRFYRHNLLSLLITTEIWYVLFYLFMAFCDPHTDVLEGGFVYTLSRLVQTVLFQNQITLGSMWYMPMILCLYTTLPFAMIVVKKLPLKALALPLVLVFANCMCIPAFNAFQKAGGGWTLHSVLREADLCAIYYLYIIAGYAVSRGLLEKLSGKLLGTLTAVSFLVACLWQLWFYAAPVNYLLMEPSPSILLTSALVFECFRRYAPRLTRWAGGLSYLARIAFAIYFVHMPIMSAMYWHLDLSALSRPVQMVLYEAVSFGGSLVIIGLLSRIGFIKKYVFLIKD